MNQAEMLVRFAGDADIDCVLLAGRYTLLDQGGLAELLPLCLERGIAVIAGGVFNSGILARPEPGAPYNYAPAAADVVGRAQRIEAACARFNVPLKAAALQFPFAHPAVTCVLTGCRSAAELEENVRLLQLIIPGELWTALKSDGLLDESAPLPPPLPLPEGRGDPTRR